jgi:hypothetical protein
VVALLVATVLPWLIRDRSPRGSDRELGEGNGAGARHRRRRRRNAVAAVVSEVPADETAPETAEAEGTTAARARDAS